MFDSRDDPEHWLCKVQSISIGNILEVFPLLWNQGIAIELQYNGGSSHLYVLLQDEVYTKNLLSFLSDLRHPKQSRIEHNAKENHVLALQQLLLSSVSGDDIDTTVCSCTICSNCIVQKNEELKKIDMGAIVITSTDLVMTDDLNWFISAQSLIQTTCYSQKMSNLIEVGIGGIYQLILNFLDEVAGTDETWTLTFGTESSLQMVVSSIRVPWEQLFSVPLSIINKNT
ncbi:hypothetical protein L9F63_021004 [Diploptera punctata]|uniref:STK11-interacting protein C-terminal PH domain-containing protein n=1 Tax=Diploptera punctata TaxID=6984 RepID=A0AAD7ZQD7_DIPPU|nr:hypothetical protein L9F63_021004 [Diploptera punctata]